MGNRNPKKENYIIHHAMKTVFMKNKPKNKIKCVKGTMFNQILHFLMQNFAATKTWKWDIHQKNQMTTNWPKSLTRWKMKNTDEALTYSVSWN